MHLIHNNFFFSFLRLRYCTGGYIHKCEVQTESSSPSPCFLVCNLTCCLNHSVPRRMMTLSGSLVGFGRYTISFLPQWQELRDLVPLRVNTRGLEGDWCCYSPKKFTGPRKSMLPIIHTHVPHTQTPKYPSVTVQPVLNVCVPDEKCQSQQPGPNLTRGAALEGAGTLTQQAAERRRKRRRA